MKISFENYCDPALAYIKNQTSQLSSLNAESIVELASDAIESFCNFQPTLTKYTGLELLSTENCRNMSNLFTAYGEQFDVFSPWNGTDTILLDDREYRLTFSYGGEITDTSELRVAMTSLLQANDLPYRDVNIFTNDVPDSGDPTAGSTLAPNDNTGADACRTKTGNGKATSDQVCVFPFKYLGFTYTKCTNAGATWYWCATSVDSDGNELTNGECSDSCDKESSWIGRRRRLQSEDMTVTVSTDNAEAVAEIFSEHDLTLTQATELSGINLNWLIERSSVDTSEHQLHLDCINMGLTQCDVESVTVTILPVKRSEDERIISVAGLNLALLMNAGRDFEAVDVYKIRAAFSSDSRAMHAEYQVRDNFEPDFMFRNTFNGYTPAIVKVEAWSETYSNTDTYRNEVQELTGGVVYDTDSAWFSGQLKWEVLTDDAPFVVQQMLASNAFDPSTIDQGVDWNGQISDLFSVNTVFNFVSLEDLSSDRVAETIDQSVYNSYSQEHLTEFIDDNVRLMLDLVDTADNIDDLWGQSSSWWNNDTQGPQSSCERILVMGWDMFGFPDVNGSVPISCGNRTCGGRAVTHIPMLAGLSGFPLVWTLETFNMPTIVYGIDWYRFANWLKLLLPVTLIGCSLFWFKGNKSYEPFLYAWACCWVVYFFYIVLPVTGYTYSYIDFKPGQDLSQYETKIIVDEYTGYGGGAAGLVSFVFWFLSALFKVGNLYASSFPLFTYMGVHAIYATISRSAGHVENGMVHLVASALLFTITAVMGFSCLIILGALYSFTQSLEVSLDPYQYQYWDFLWDFIFDGVPQIPSVIVIWWVSFIFLAYMFATVFRRMKVLTGNVCYNYLHYLFILLTAFFFITAPYVWGIPGGSFRADIMIPILFYIVNYWVGKYTLTIMFEPKIAADENAGWYSLYIGFKYPGIFLKNIGLRNFKADKNQPKLEVTF